MKKKAFTLVELLIVIVILGVILFLAVPKLLCMIKGCKKQAMENNVRMLAVGGESEYKTRLNKGTLDQDKNPIVCSDISKLDSKHYKDCTITFDENGVATVTLYGVGNFKGFYCIDCTKDNLNVKNNKCMLEKIFKTEF